MTGDFVQAAASERVALTSGLDAQPLLVIGGRQRGDRSLLDNAAGWYGYGTGVIVRIDGSGGDVVHTYVSRPGTHGEGDAILFKSASRRGDQLFCCTQTEVMRLRLPSFAEEAYVSLPMFNDVHHVVPTGDDTVLVAVSGMNLVIEMTMAGRVLREWNVLGEDTWAARDRNVDYRIATDLRPHTSHPNHVFRLGDEPFATRFEQRDAVSLIDPTRRIDLGGERVHDGLVHEGRIYFTTVDGNIVIADADTLDVVERVQLRRRIDGDREQVLGWCRSLYIEGGSCWVGFSRIRPTKLRQTVSWVRTGGAAQAPTRIARYRMSSWDCDAEIDLEPYGLNAVFSILPDVVPAGS